jgi:hypothetical protein
VGEGKCECKVYLLARLCLAVASKCEERTNNLVSFDKISTLTLFLSSVMKTLYIRHSFSQKFNVFRVLLSTSSKTTNKFYNWDLLIIIVRYFPSPAAPLLLFCLEKEKEKNHYRSILSLPLFFCFA